MYSARCDDLVLAVNGCASIILGFAMSLTVEYRCARVCVQLF